MGTELRQQMNRFVEFINTADEAIGAEVISPEAVFHVPFLPEPVKGVAGYLTVIGVMRAGFSDVQWTLEETIVEGDTVACRFTLTGTHDGTFFGTAPTGRPVWTKAVNIYRFTDGLITDELGMPDLLALLGQIGALPPFDRAPRGSR